MDQQASQTNISQIPTSPQTLVQSSMVVGYSYDSTSYTLDVWFAGPKASVYRYYLVYPNIVSQMFDNGGSIGRNVLSNLKSNQKIKLK